jgi:hypothetical protein
MAKKTPSARAARRDLARKNDKLTRDLERLFRMGPGGSPERPIELESASQVEIHAASLPCPICHGAHRVEEHVAETVSGVRLRVARVTCTMCGARREVYFRLGTALPS